MIRDWFHRNWMHAGFVAGLFLLAVVPLLAGAFDLPFLLVYLQLPVYMLHQLEEHQGDRFRAFVNARLAGGRDALTTAAVVVINVPLVWGIDLAAIYLA
ncbi:MAG: HXXEE domain-containing protein, partial [Bauldia sp.]